MLSSSRSAHGPRDRPQLSPPARERSAGGNPLLTGKAIHYLAGERRVRIDTNSFGVFLHKTLPSGRILGVPDVFSELFHRTPRLTSPGCRGRMQGDINRGMHRTSGKQPKYFPAHHDSPGALSSVRRAWPRRYVRRNCPGSGCDHLYRPTHLRASSN